MVARLLIKMGDGCYLSGQEGQEGWNTHNSFDNIGFVSDVLPAAQVTLIKAHPWPPCNIPSHWFSHLEGISNLSLSLGLPVCGLGWARVN